jgi:hypothetical protein
LINFPGGRGTSAAFQHLADRRIMHWELAMTFRPFLTAFFLGTLVCGSARPALAHHSFSAEFDEKKCGELTGTLTGVDWQNPHPYFFVEGKNQKGETAKMTFQTSSIANMTRGGTPRAYFIENMGKMVIVRACASINGTDNRFAASWVRLPNEPIHRTGQDVEGIFGSNN